MKNNLIKQTRGPECCSVIGKLVLHYSTLPSTNKTVLDKAAEGVPEGMVIVAKSQTEGHGRLGRTWYSPKDEGLYFSILLRPRCHHDRIMLLPLVAGVSVALAFEKLGVKNVALKWPNDVLVSEKKAAGILVESTETAGKRTFAVGIGVNVSNSSFHEEISDRATSIFLETGFKHTSEEVLSFILGEFERFYADLCLGRNDTLLAEMKRLDFLFGKKVRVTLKEEISGKASGIDKNGALILETQTGEKLKIQSGEVLLVRKET